MDRRKFLYTSTLSTLVLAGCGSSDTTSTTTTSTSSTASKLFIPPEVKGKLINGIYQYDMTIKSGTSEFIAGLKTPTYGINNAYLGSTIRLIDGQSIKINFKNTLGESTTMHEHGLHLPPAMDGGPFQEIKAGTTWTAEYTVNQKASTCWYHSHLMDKTGEQVLKGLAGMIIIDDLDSQTLNLPKTYGVDDIPLVIQDRRFNNDGSFDYTLSNQERMRGYDGDRLLINGTINPYINLSAKEIRFRLLNGSNAKVYNFAFRESISFSQIATDASFLEKPLTLQNIKLSPAERAEIVVDFSDSLDKEFVLYDTLSNKDIITLKITQESTEITTLPSSLTTLTKFTQSQAVKTRVFTLAKEAGMAGKFTINGVSMDVNVVNETIKLDDIEVWEVVNTMNMTHNFHIHDSHFMLIERNGSASNVRESEKGYKDTVILEAQESVKFIVQMKDYTDDVNTYMYHCHILEHEDNGMMGQFKVVK